MSTPPPDHFADTYPPSVANWLLKRSGAECRSISEYAIYSDARVDGDALLPDSPYTFLTTQAWGTRTSGVRNVIALRLEDYLPNKSPDFSTTDASLHHGGWLKDEIAALLSLVTGARMQAGEKTRVFWPRDDELGRTIHDDSPIPVLHYYKHFTVLPSAIDGVKLPRIFPIDRICDLSPPQSIALIRAARLYQDAIWLVESQPAMTWLLLVSALETAANQWKADDASPKDRLRASLPELTNILNSSGGEELVDVVATKIAHTLGATKKFIDFALTYLPPPPPVRPKLEHQIAWEGKSLKKLLSQIYGYRSQALHGGTPFPSPMCLPVSQSGDGHEEVGTAGYASASVGGVWIRGDLPMQLHVFEYIVRGALLGWWRETADANAGHT